MRVGEFLNRKVNKVDFLNISPFVRYIHHLTNANSTNYYLPWRYIYDYELIYIVDGCMTVLTDQGTYQLDAGDIHVMTPMVKHRRLVKEDEFCNYYSIHFDFVYMGEENDFSPEDTYIAYCNTDLVSAPTDAKLADRPLYMLGEIELPQKLHTLNQAAYIDVLNKVCDAFAGKEFAYEIDLKRGMLSVFKLMLIDMKTQFINHNLAAHDDDISSIIQYLYDNVSKPISFETLCRLKGYSLSSFRNLFKQKTGKPPNEFLTDIRIDKAVELLNSNKYTVTQVSQMVGYQDNHYFSRLFKQKKGFSPGNLIKQQDD